MSKQLFLVTMVIYCTSALAADDKPEALPEFDLVCSRSTAVSFTSPSEGGESIGIDGDSLPRPRYQLISDGQTLKVIERPEEDDLRKASLKTLADLTFDFSGKDFIFGWQERSVAMIVAYALNVKDSSFNVVHAAITGTLPIVMSQVFNCK